MPEANTVSDELERWLAADGDKTLGGLVDVFEEKSFAVLFIVTMGWPALPLPTGGATHVVEAIAGLLALQLIAGRDEVWLPDRWARISLTGSKRERFLRALLRFLRFLERFAKPRMRFLFGTKASNVVFGLLVLGCTIGAFFAPPFTGLDTLPSLGALLISVGVLLEDALIVLAGLVVGAAGVLLEVLLGKAAVHQLKRWL